MGKNLSFQNLVPELRYSGPNPVFGSGGPFQHPEPSNKNQIVNMKIRTFLKNEVHHLVGKNLSFQNIVPELRYSGPNPVFGPGGPFQHPEPSTKNQILNMKIITF